MFEEFEESFGLPWGIEFSLMSFLPEESPMRRAALFLFPCLALLLAAWSPAALRGAPRQTVFQPLTITTPSLPSGVVNTEYTAIVLAAGGLAPYSFAVVSGSLPAGLILDGGTGTIRGTPTATGSSNFTVQVTDTENPPVQKTQNLEIVVVMG
jgi:hypothetical protein